MKNSTPDPRTELENVPLEKLTVFINGEALALRVAELEKPILARAQAMLNFSPTFPLNIRAAMPFIGSLLVEDHAALKCARDVVIGSPEYVAARAIIEPIIARCESAARAEQAHTAEIGARKAALAEATTAAQAKAALAANKDAGVIAARRALQEAELVCVGALPELVIE